MIIFSMKKIKESRLNHKSETEGNNTFIQQSTT